VEALGISLNGVIAYAVNFTLLIVLLRVLLYKPVTKMLHTRQERIAEGLQAADRAAADAAEQRSQFDKELQEARAVAQADAKVLAEQTEQMRAETVRAAELEAEQIRAQAREEMERERAQVAGELQHEAAELALAISRKVVGAAVDEATQRRLVDQFVAELDT
jgi:F-type H+-transporting ATPase subunit b